MFGWEISIYYLLTKTPCDEHIFIKFYFLKKLICTNYFKNKKYKNFNLFLLVLFKSNFNQVK